MEIQLSEIPEEGLRREGELTPAQFGLAPDDSIRPAGTVRYSVDIHRADDCVVFHGRLHGPFQLQCGACLDYFDYEADFPEWSSELELEPGQSGFDLGEVMREDFLLALPSRPRCDELPGARECPKAAQLRARLAESSGAEPSGEEAWGALDEWRGG